MNLLLLVALSIAVKGVSFTPMEVERLPELNIPRQAHSLHYAGGEYTVIGGHTVGFVPTATAEYYRGGKWHTVNTLYPHDAGFSTKLNSGDILTGGGYAEAFGVGQTWGVEVYHPASHSFSSLPILDNKRTHATALEMADGRILVAGNWYGPDALECSTAGEPFTTLKPLQPRNLPYLLQVAPDNVYIFGATDHYGNPLEGSWVEQLIGEPFQEPLLQEWVTENGAMPNPPEHYILGEYRYLIPVRKQDALSFLKLDNGTFELLETAHPIPQEGPWGAIDWQYGLAVDTTAQSAWKQGRDAQGRLYLLSIGYGESPAAVQVFYSEPLEDLPYKAEVLALSGGQVLLAGGVRADSYDAQGTVLLCYTQGDRPRSVSYWLGLAVGSLFALLLCLLGWYLSRRKASAQAGSEKEFIDLENQIVRLMEEEQLFRKKDLRIADIATLLHTNTTYISATLNSGLGMSFPRFVTSYRVRYAQEQMRQHPEKKLSVISEEAGFASENSFFRAFRTETGLTPTEWREKQGS
jgi:AraC-like DNA-binding protein